MRLRHSGKMDLVLQHLQAAMSSLEERAASEPRLDRYRVSGDGSALDRLPDGWMVSEAIALIATQGGWWPGEWMFSNLDNTVPLALTGRDETPADSSVRWIGVGSVWERDVFYTPAVEGPQAATAPLFGFSTQALWTSMVFPDEAALLEAFLVTYDELGLDEHDEVNPFFVEWVTRAPAAHEPPAAHRVHRQLVELSEDWTTDHPCWVDYEMPHMSWEPGLCDWPEDVVAAILGRPAAP